MIVIALKMTAHDDLQKIFVKLVLVLAVWLMLMLEMTQTARPALLNFGYHAICQYVNRTGFQVQPRHCVPHVQESETAGRPTDDKTTPSVQRTNQMSAKCNGQNASNQFNYLLVNHRLPNVTT